MSELAGAKHESYVQRTRPLYAIALGLAATIVLTLLVVRVLFGALDRAGARVEAPRHPLAEELEAQPEPRLLEDPDAYRSEYVEEQRERTEGYGWVDREQGVVRIPLERAAELVEKEGLPFR